MITKAKTSFPPVSILSIFVFSLIYWIYLAFATNMNISCDAIGYEELGRMLQNQGIDDYVKTGPRREPLYPLLISLSMHIEHISGIGYAKIMAVFGALILLISQVLVYMILRQLNVRTWICALILIYFGLSPALNNTAFSLYSEVTTYPFILGVIWFSGQAWQAMNQNRLKTAATYSATLGLLFASVTLVKAVFEIIFPAYILIFTAAALLSGPKIKQQLRIITACAVIAAGSYYIPILGYKQLNKIYNGHFVITNRGAWALYGNTARRMEPLTFERFLTALTYVPGEGVCTALFGEDDCRFWSFWESDTFGLGKLGELNNQGLSKTQIDTALIDLSKQKVLQNPPQYALLTALEGGKMFFWESTQIGFVQYPGWLQKLYDNHLFKDVLRLLISLVTLICFLWTTVIVARRLCPPMIGSIILLTSLYILSYSFFFILTRYALPVAPLYLIVIGYALNHWLTPRNSKTGSMNSVQ